MISFSQSNAMKFLGIGHATNSISSINAQRLWINKALPIAVAFVIASALIANDVEQLFSCKTHIKTQFRWNYLTASAKKCFSLRTKNGDISTRNEGIRMKQKRMDGFTLDLPWSDIFENQMCIHFMNLVGNVKFRVTQAEGLGQRHEPVYDIYTIL